MLLKGLYLYNNLLLVIIIILCFIIKLNYFNVIKNHLVIT